MAKPGEVLGLFDSYNVVRETIEKCALKPKDTSSTFLLTFSTIQVFLTKHINLIFIIALNAINNTTITNQLLFKTASFRTAKERLPI